MFEFQLMLVADVLVTAAAAASKVGAFRFGAMGRLCNDLLERSFGELLLLLRDSRGNLLSVDCERHENRLAFETADAVAAEGDIMDVK
jgi:hypothetical protein